jgi:hypothetical protein
MFEEYPDTGRMSIRITGGTGKSRTRDRFSASVLVMPQPDSGAVVFTTPGASSRMPYFRVREKGGR